MAAFTDASTKKTLDATNEIAEERADENNANLCLTPNCGKSATMSCPKCLTLGINDSFFCSQDCFKGYWSEHKKAHKKAQNYVIPPEFRNYTFTGPLRPCRKTPQVTVPDTITPPDYAITSFPAGEAEDRRNNTSIRVFTAEEIEGMRHSCHMGREVLDIAGKAVRKGVTTEEINRVVHEACLERDCYPSPLNYHRFPKSVCTSVNEVICHGIPDTRELEEGDIVNIDVTTYTGGYHGDLNETFFVGQVDEESENLVRTAYECLKSAVSLVKPGAMYRDLGPAIAKTAATNGFSVVRTYCGHGIGSLFHTAPNVPHYAKNKAKGVMKAGHIFTIEPMINAGTYRDTTWPDNWSAVTLDGRRSAQFEHTMVVTDDDRGVELLTAREGETEMKWNGGDYFRR